MATRFIPGQWNVLCDVCGLQYKSGELRKRWDGLMVCTHDMETRHPQTLLRVPKEEIHPAWTRPESQDLFISVTYPLAVESDDMVYLMTEAGVIIQTEG